MLSTPFHHPSKWIPTEPEQPYTVKSSTTEELVLTRGCDYYVVSCSFLAEHLVAGEQVWVRLSAGSYMSRMICFLPAAPDNFDMWRHKSGLEDYCKKEDPMSDTPWEEVRHYQANIREGAELLVTRIEPADKMTPTPRMYLSDHHYVGLPKGFPVSVGDSLVFGARADDRMIQVRRNLNTTVQPSSFPRSNTQVLDDLVETTPTTPTKEHSMIGKIYDAAVVRTETLTTSPSSSQQVSTVIFIKNGFVAQSPEVARAVVTIEAQKANEKVNFADPTAPVEIKLREWVVS